jgi:hypothetical protein
MQDKVRVRTVEGRVARESPRGEYIPTDRFVTVRRTPYIERLLYVHGDIVLEPTAEAQLPLGDDASPKPTGKAK